MHPTTPDPLVARTDRFANRRRFGWVVLILFFGVVSLPVFGLIRHHLIGTPPSAVEWRSDFDAAKAEAVETGRPMLVDFTASWCPPCQVMERQTWPDATVGRLMNERFVPVKLDVDTPPGQRLGQHYGVIEIPTILVLDATGGVLDVGSFMTAAEMKAFLERDRALPTTGPAGD